MPESNVTDNRGLWRSDQIHIKQNRENIDIRDQITVAGIEKSVRRQKSRSRFRSYRFGIDTTQC